MTTDTFASQETMELDSAALERALSELWQQATGTGNGAPVARARALTLIVYTEDDESMEFAGRVAQALPERHPCRGILLHVRPDQDGPLRAGVTIQCAVGGGERKVCSEQITVTAGGDSRQYLADAVLPLIVTDLPAVVWWTGRPRPADPVLRRFARGAVDRVLLDSNLFRDPGAGLIALARWCEDPARRAVLADLAWERLRGWRQLIAQTMDPPDARVALRRVREVTIVHGGAGSLPEECLLLAGWLASSLDWRPLDSPSSGVLTFSDGGRTVTLRLAVEGRGGGERISAVRLVTEEGAAFGVREGGQPGLIVCTEELEGRAPLERVVPTAARDPVDLVVSALGRYGADPVYDAALAMAAEIAILGVTA